MKTKHQRNRNQPRVRASYDKKSGLVRLNVPLTVKAETIDKNARTFEGLAATWDEDLGQDVIHKGAFADSITEWKNGDHAMPLLNSHDQFNIFSALGQATALKETKDGLWSKWEVIEGDDGDKVLSRLRPSKATGRPIIGKMSIGFIPQKFEFEQPDGTDSFWDRIRHINKADLKEVSLVLFPMNPNASIDATTVKMWLDMAQKADPRMFDQLTRLELRRLNSKIGLLLSKSGKPKDDELEEEDDSQTPSTRKSSAPKKKVSKERKDVDDSDDDTDDTDDELDDTDDHGDEADLTDDDLEDDDDAEDSDDDEDTDYDDDDSSDEDDDDADDADDDSTEPKSRKTPVKKKDQKVKDEDPDPKEKTYEFSEALAHRLKQLALRDRRTDVERRRSES